MRLAASRIAAVVGIGLVIPIVTPGASVAAPPSAVGWWHRASTDLPTGTPIGTPITATREPLAPVPEGGLHVANDASGPRAISAIRFSAATGGGTLTLRVAGDPFMPLGARLLACPVSTTWDPTANGEWDDRPELNCDNSADGEFTEDRSVVVFEMDDLAEFSTSGAIDIAVLPAADEVATFAVSFEAPDDTTLVQATPPPVPPTLAVEAPAADDSPSPVVAPVPRTPPAPVPASPPTTSADRPVEEARLVPAQPSVGSELLRLDTDGGLRAAITAALGLLAGVVWLWSGGPLRLWPLARGGA